jgi:hypothetical protein
LKDEVRHGDWLRSLEMPTPGRGQQGLRRKKLRQPPPRSTRTETRSSRLKTPIHRIPATCRPRKRRNRARFLRYQTARLARRPDWPGWASPPSLVVLLWLYVSKSRYLSFHRPLRPVSRSSTRYCRRSMMAVDVVVDGKSDVAIPFDSTPV